MRVGGTSKQAKPRERVGGVNGESKLGERVGVGGCGRGCVSEVSG